MWKERRKLINRLKYLSEILRRYENIFPEIYAEGVQAARKGNVKKYIFIPSGKVLWLIVGREFEYLVTSYYDKDTLEERFLCSCPDFLFHILLKTRPDTLQRRKYCYHIIARIYSELEEIKKALNLKYDERGLPETIAVEDNYFEILILEILEMINAQTED